MIKIKTVLNDVPLAVKRFLGKAFLFFITWKLIYLFFLYESKFLDHPLTTHIGVACSKLLNNIGVMDGFVAKRGFMSFVYNGEVINEEASQIFHNEKLVLNIADACNALELIVLYIGFIVCMPSSFKRKTLYIFIGVLILDGINILRCTGLIYLQEYFQAYFDFAHHYLFKVIIYASTFFIWKYYARNINLKNESI